MELYSLGNVFCSASCDTCYILLQPSLWLAHSLSFLPFHASSLQCTRWWWWLLFFLFHSSWSELAIGSGLGSTYFHPATGHHLTSQTPAIVCIVCFVLCLLFAAWSVCVCARVFDSVFFQDWLCNSFPSPLRESPHSRLFRCFQLVLLGFLCFLSSATSIPSQSY